MDAPAWSPAYDDVGECVEATLRRLGNRIVLGTPLGIGKPSHLLNEFWRRAARDPNLRLTIFTALSLNRPAAGSRLEARFLEPLVARVFGDYVDLEYPKAMRANRVPPNVEIREFYVQAGAWLGVPHLQQHYLSANYTHAARDLVAAGVNVIAQQVAARPQAGTRATEYSLSSNPDLTLDVLPALDAARKAGRDAVVIGAVNRRLPFMLGDAVVPESRFDALVDHPRYEYDPFAPPNGPIGTVEHAIGLNASALIRDGGTLQLGIGELSDAVVYALTLRHQRNDAWRSALAATGAAERFTTEIDAIGGRSPFERGLYGCTELFVDGFLDLYRAGILKRPVYQHALLQRLLDDGELDERPSADWLATLARHGLERLDAREFAALGRCGAFRPGTRYEHGEVIASDGERTPADLADARARERLAATCLARRLDGGLLMHAAFLLGPRGFYGALRELPEAERARFWMTRVGYTNDLFGADHDLRVAQRRHARFVNTTMMVTGLGAAVSDGLADGQVVSGVGGQYNFVAMAHELPEGHSMLCVRSTRTKHGRTSSNVVWNYGHVTLPRHLRDVFVTEYGIAHLRGCTDRECVAALLAVTDSRFQDELLAEAKRAGKIETSYRIPERHRQNFPERLARGLREHRRGGFFSEFPFGTDYTAEEIVLAKALRRLQALGSGWQGRLRGAALAARGRPDRADLRPYLQRMRLDAPAEGTERREARLVAAAVAEVLERDPLDP
ncbi:MAG: acetyl-CoA hydrolase [Steroidobacteraceae bacterium]|nr:acetyl-CoA hydrolase [Steroidobacteraceae bacterium]